MANRIIVQTNDYFSWEVEANTQEKDRVFNAIIWLMKEHHISEEQAKSRLKSYIMKDEQAYQAMLDGFHKTHPNLPIHLRKYIASGPLLVAGNHHWSAVCPRYRPVKLPDRKQFPDENIEIDQMTVRGSDSSEIDQCMPKLDLDKCPAVKTTDNTSLDNSALLAIPHYIQSLPSKNIRSQLVDAFNVWFELPEDRTSLIKRVIEELHGSTLILDDIHDESILRGGRSTAHGIFGPAQCTNSALYMVVQAAVKIFEYRFQAPQATGVLLEGLVKLTLGQSWDLNWKFNSYCPSITEYMAMVDGKTGAMFNMLTRLMQAMSPLRIWPMAEFDHFAQLLARWFQIRDDVQNLQDPEYAEQRGFCEDLDEGKLSYPVILCCNSDPAARDIILGIFRRNAKGTPLAYSVKMQILDLLKKTGALQETRQVVQQLEKEVEKSLSALETVLGKPNPLLRLITNLLGGIPPP